MASSSSALMRFQSACVTCVRRGQRTVLHYRDFLLDPGMLFTLASLLLLIAASIQTPDGLVNSAHAHTWLYLAAALAGFTASFLIISVVRTAAKQHRS